MNAQIRRKAPWGMLAAAPLCALATVGVTLRAALAEEAPSGIEAIMPDMAEFIPMAIAFIILCIVLAKFGWPAFQGMIDKRDAAIREQLDKSEAARQESERVLEEYRKELADAKDQAARILASAKESAQALEADAARRADEESKRMIEAARSAIEVEKKAAIAELKSSLVDTSVAIAAKVTGETLDDAAHRKIIERYVDEAGGFDGK